MTSKDPSSDGVAEVVARAIVHVEPVDLVAQPGLYDRQGAGEKSEEASAATARVQDPDGMIAWKSGGLGIDDREQVQMRDVLGCRQARYGRRVVHGRSGRDGASGRRAQA
jgi:hypothetical protein